MIFRYIGYTALALICSAILVFAVLTSYYLMDRHMPVQVHAIKILTPEVPQGGKLKVGVSVTYLRDCKIHSDRFIRSQTDGTRKTFEDIDFERAPAPLNEAQFYPFTYDIPADFPIGDATYHSMPWYACNWVHRYLWPLMPAGTILPFKVTPRKD